MSASDLGREEEEGLILTATDGKRRAADGKVRTNCPLCVFVIGKEDRGASFELRRGGGYKCFRCGVWGRLRNVDGPRYGFDVIEKPVVPLELPEGHHELYTPRSLRSARLESFRDYLATRPGASVEAFTKFRIGGVIKGWFKGRILIPVRDPTGRLRWYVTRDITGTADKKYLYPKGDRGGVMFNEAALDDWTDRPAIIVEGCFDAIPFDPDGIAVLGKPNEVHLAKFVAARRPTVFVLDGDAYELGWSLAMRCRLRGGTSGSVRMPPKMDPDEAIEEVREAARYAVREGEVHLGGKPWGESTNSFTRGASVDVPRAITTTQHDDTNQGPNTMTTIESAIIPSPASNTSGFATAFGREVHVSVAGNTLTIVGLTREEMGKTLAMLASGEGAAPSAPAATKPARAPKAATATTPPAAPPPAAAAADWNLSGQGSDAAAGPTVGSVVAPVVAAPPPAAAPEAASDLDLGDDMPNGKRVYGAALLTPEECAQLAADKKFLNVITALYRAGAGTVGSMLKSIDAIEHKGIVNLKAKNGPKAVREALINVLIGNNAIDAQDATDDTKIRAL